VSFEVNKFKKEKYRDSEKHLSFIVDSDKPLLEDVPRSRNDLVLRD